MWIYIFSFHKLLWKSIFTCHYVIILDLNWCACFKGVCLVRLISSFLNFVHCFWWLYRKIVVLLRPNIDLFFDLILLVTLLWSANRTIVALNSFNNDHCSTALVFNGKLNIWLQSIYGMFCYVFKAFFYNVFSCLLTDLLPNLPLNFFNSSYQIVWPFLLHLLWYWRNFCKNFFFILTFFWIYHLHLVFTS